jgi:hypothetical protein
MENWVSLILVLAMAAGLFFGGRSLFSSPIELFNFGVALVKALIPIITAPEDPETRKKRQAVERSGGQWDPIRKREKK